MLGLRCMMRANFRKSSLSPQFSKLSLSTSTRNSSGDEDKASDTKPKNQIDEKQKNAINKLNALLSTMVEEDRTIAASKVKSVLARPKRVAKKMVAVQQPTNESQVKAAARSAAVSLGGDVETTESELLARFRSQPPPEQRLAEPIVPRSEESRIETARNLTSLLSGMRVEKEPSTKANQDAARSLGEGDRPWEDRKGGERGQRRGDWKERRGDSDRYDFRPRKAPERVDLFGSEPLNIFKTDQPPAAVLDLATWGRCSERELCLVSTHPPGNHFQEMIQWTSQGKLWRFPIDNEQGLEAEKAVSFTRHVFFDAALEVDDWCRSPEVRHFMDLVCLGLSKNPFISADDKLAHIDWFRRYFADKGHLIDGVSQPVEKEANTQQQSL